MSASVCPQGWTRCLEKKSIVSKQKECVAFLTKILEILVKVKNATKYDNNDPKGQRVTEKLANVLYVLAT